MKEVFTRVIAVIIVVSAIAVSSRGDDQTSVPSSDTMDPQDANSAETRVLDRTKTDALLVVQDNGVVNEDDLPGFVTTNPLLIQASGNNGFSIERRGDLRVASALWGQHDVICLHPHSPTSPARLDFSKLTSTRSGSLLLHFHNYPGGSSQAVALVNGRELAKIDVAGDEWHSVTVPFAHNLVMVEIRATGWYLEHAFVTYEFSITGSRPVAHADSVTTQPSVEPLTADSAVLPVTAEDVAERRQKMLASVKGQLKNAQQLFDQLPDSAKAVPGTLARRLTALKAEKERILAIPNSELSAEILSERQKVLAKSASANAAPVVEPSAVVALSEPHWQDGGIADPQNLAECLNAVSLKVLPFDGTMVAQPTDPSHLTLIIRIVNSGLGDVTELPAGKLWIQNGSLMLQWIDKQASITAIEKLKYAALETTDADGNTVKRFSFSGAITSSLPLEPDASIRIAIPAPVAAGCKLTFATTPSGWDLSEPDKFTEVLRHDPAIARLMYNSRTSRVSITCNEIDAVDPVHQLAALQTQLSTAQRQLAETTQRYNDTPTENTTVNNGVFGSRSYASPRQGLADDMQREQEHIDKLQGWIDKAQRDLDANTAAAPASLEGVVVSLLLPNGIEVARIKLGSDDSK